MNDRYRALRAVALLLRVLAWIVAVFGGLFVAGAAIVTGFDAGNPVQGLTIAVGGTLAVALQALTLFAVSALISLFIDIEQNTRAAAEMIAHLSQAVAAR
jgi:hypothetical protein